jgi:hypothetical protein
VIVRQLLETLKNVETMSEPAYFPYRAHKNRPYIAEFLTLPDKERRWDVLTQMALFGTRRAFGDQ